MTAARWRQLTWGVLLLAYALLAHYSNLGRAPPMLGRHSPDASRAR